jgi:hypothetical protein
MNTNEQLLFQIVKRAGFDTIASARRIVGDKRLLKDLHAEMLRGPNSKILAGKRTINARLRKEAGLRRPQGK